MYCTNNNKLDFLDKQPPELTIVGKVVDGVGGMSSTTMSVSMIILGFYKSCNPSSSKVGLLTLCGLWKREKTFKNSQNM